MEADLEPTYIQPITRIYSSVDEARGFYGKYGSITLFNEEKKLELLDLGKGYRNLIVGEPGVGKSLLVKKLKKYFEDLGHYTNIIKLRDQDCLQKIDSFVNNGIDKKTLFLDGLDEVKSSIFPEVLQKIENIADTFPAIQIYISSRWVFIDKYANSFPKFRCIAISPFTTQQVKEYLIAAGHKEEEIDELQSRIMSFSHQLLVIQIPRYLFYLQNFLRANGVDAASKVSRNELFEYFIYSKLDIEGEKIRADKRAIIKRVLEKIALIMEIYQTNTITKDELMTFFDELQSDLKMVALSQIDIEHFYDYSLLKNNDNSIEFDNTEFQEYLAAKEISRFLDPNHATFAFSVDTNIGEIYPTWYNALTFLVDIEPDLLEQLIDFSGIRSGDFKVIDESFLTFIGRVDVRKMKSSLKAEIFQTIVTYHNNKRQWLSSKLASALPNFFTLELEQTLKKYLEDAEATDGANRYVPLGNIAYVIAYLWESKYEIDSSYWENRFMGYINDPDENGVLQRHSLFALGYLKDTSIIDKLPNLNSRDDLIGQSLLSLCINVDPDHPKSVEYFIEGVRKDNIIARFGIYALKKEESLKRFLEVYSSDDDFRKEFLNNNSIHQDRDSQIIEKIQKVINAEIIELVKRAVVQSLASPYWYYSSSNSFTKELWKLLEQNSSSFFGEIISQLKSTDEGKGGLHFAGDFFSDVISRRDVTEYIDAMISVGERNAAFYSMLTIKHSQRQDKELLFELGRDKLVTEYEDWEKRPALAAPTSDEWESKLIKEFKNLLEPEPGKYRQNVFEFYNRNRARLDLLMSLEDRERLIELVTGTVFKHVEPIGQKFVITSEKDGEKNYSMSNVIHLFGESLKIAKHLKIDVSSYRKNILSYIPYAFDEELDSIFELVKNISGSEMTPVIEVYKNKSSDLWRHHPISFVRAIEQYHVVGAVPLLKKLSKDDQCDKYARQAAITVIDNLLPDITFLKEIFDKYKDADDKAIRNIAEIAVGRLITNHGDSEAIKRHLREIISKVEAFERDFEKGVRSVSDIESELDYKHFAKPLVNLKYRGYELDFIAFLDEAMKIWARGPLFHAYATYMWEIVYSYIDNLKEYGDYTPLRVLEEKIVEYKNLDGVNWLAAKMVHLRRAYLAYLGKPKNISFAIKKYNDTRGYSNRNIRDSNDLFQHLKDGLETDLQKWIEGEGAYELIKGAKVFESKRQEYEKLIQKTLKGQIENILLRRGFQADVSRESELMDGKRGDFLVRYGFIGPIVIEVKLTSNSDLKSADLTKSPSYESMRRYMNGYSATHGIFLVIDNEESSNLNEIKSTFQKIKNVWVQSFAVKQLDKDT